MEITEVRVKLVEKSRERLRAFCSVTFDGAFVVRDLKVIGSGAGEGVFVAMPSRKLCDRCPRCRAKNHLRARFCNECGAKLGDHRVSKDSHGRAKIHADVAHPINTECRERIQSAVLKAYEQEVERSKAPDYKPAKFDDMEEVFVDDLEPAVAEAPQDRSPSPRRPQVVEEADELEEVSKESESAFSDYDSLIAELKQEAASREDRRRDRQGSPRRQAVPPAAEPQSASGADQRERRSGRDRRERVSGGQRQKEERSDFGADLKEEQASASATIMPGAAATAPAQEPETKGHDEAFGAGLG